MADIILGTFNQTSKGKKATNEVRVATGVYMKAPEHTDIRAYYLDSEGEYKPSKEAIRIDKEYTKDLISALAKVYGEDISKSIDSILDKINSK